MTQVNRRSAVTAEPPWIGPEDPLGGFPAHGLDAIR